MSAVTRLIGYLESQSAKRDHAVPCNYGCGAALPIGDEHTPLRVAHYETCPAAKAFSLKQRTQGLIDQNRTGEKA